MSCAVTIAPLDQNSTVHTATAGLPQRCRAGWITTLPFDFFSANLCAQNGFYGIFGGVYPAPGAPPTSLSPVTI